MNDSRSRKKLRDMKQEKIKGYQGEEKIKPIKIHSVKQQELSVQFFWFYFFDFILFYSIQSGHFWKLSLELENRRDFRW